MKEIRKKAMGLLFILTIFRMDTTQPRLLNLAMAGRNTSPLW